MFLLHNTAHLQADDSKLPRKALQEMRSHPHCLSLESPLSQLTSIVVDKLCRSVCRGDTSQLSSVWGWKIWCYQLRVALEQILSPLGTIWKQQALAIDSKIVLCHYNLNCCSICPWKKNIQWVVQYFWNINQDVSFCFCSIDIMSAVNISKVVVKIL